MKIYKLRLDYELKHFKLHWGKCEKRKIMFWVADLSDVFPLWRTLFIQLWFKKCLCISYQFIDHNPNDLK